ncbi:MAG: aldehyde ferredoxin oxidoreductase family protein [Anaerolineae bacterium]
MFPYAAYAGRVLRVDLTGRRVWEEPLAPELAEKYLGGRALGARLLYDEVGPEVDPLSPDNKLIFTTGPLVGTLAPSSARFCLHTKSPLTGIYLYSICSGFLGPELKSAGYDVLIVEGQADRPIYLSIVGSKVEFVDAAHLWGMDAIGVQEVVGEELHRYGEAWVAAIGPAGENLSRMACVLSELRAAGRGGAGAVMGSKRLKALAVIGRRGVQVHDLPGFMQLVRGAWQRIDETPFLRQGLSRYGSAISAGLTSEHGVMPVNNWRNGTLAGIEGLLPKQFREQTVIHDNACPTCTVACSKLCRGSDGAISEGPEYETIYSFGTACGVGDIGRVVQADMLCDQLGLDTISAGVTVAYLMECVERGLVGPEMLDGLDVRFGHGEVLPALLHLMAHRQGPLGELLADGVELARRRLGIEDDSFAMHAKGMELGGYDPRGVKGQSLVFATGPRGGCHHANGYVILEEVASGKHDRFALEGKADIVHRARNFRMVIDSAMYCAFQGGALNLEVAAALLNAATGMEWDVPGLLALSERASDLERAYNVREGVRRADDRLPGRLLNEPLPDGPSAGHTVDLDPLLDDFYRECGWDVETGVPTADKLRSVGLEDVAAALATLG